MTEQITDGGTTLNRNTVYLRVADPGKLTDAEVQANETRKQRPLAAADLASAIEQLITFAASEAHLPVAFGAIKTQEMPDGLRITLEADAPARTRTFILEVREEH